MSTCLAILGNIPALVGGSVWGILIGSFALTGVLIFVSNFLTARGQAELATPLTVLTFFLLFFAEHAGNFYWSLQWDGTTKSESILLLVFCPVFLLGTILLSQWHFAGWKVGAAISGIHVAGKVCFAIFAGGALLGKLGLHGPSPASVWYTGESWQVRETAFLRINLPSELHNSTEPGIKRVTYISPMEGLRGDLSAKNRPGEALVHQINEAWFGQYHVTVRMMSDSHTDFDLNGCIGRLLEETRSTQVTDISSSEVKEFEIASFPARRLSISFTDYGDLVRRDAVVVASGQTAWIVEIMGLASVVKDRADRMLGSIEFVDPLHPVPSSVTVPRIPGGGPSPNSPPQPQNQPEESHQPAALPAPKPKPQETFPFERTIVDQSGRQMKARILGMIDQSIRLERLADGKEFVIPLSSLSNEDRTFFDSLKQ